MLNLDMSLTQLSPFITVRMYNAFRAAEYYTLREIVSRSYKDLVYLKNLGRKSLQPFIELLIQHDHHVKIDDKEPLITLPIIESDTIEEECCKNCLAYVLDECHRKAPTINAKDGDAVFPYINRKNWCYEHIENPEV